MFNLSFKMNKNIFHYCTGTLFNQKHSVQLKTSTSLKCPLCHHSDSALHILSGCQHQVISGMITECHDIACRLIMKAIEAGSLGGCFVRSFILWRSSTVKIPGQGASLKPLTTNMACPVNTFAELRPMLASTLSFWEWEVPSTALIV